VIIPTANSIATYTEGGSLRDENADTAAPKGPMSKTDTGRTVYSGGGINPDVMIKPDTISIERNRFHKNSQTRFLRLPCSSLQAGSKALKITR